MDLLKLFFQSEFEINNIPIGCHDLSVNNKQIILKSESKYNYIPLFNYKRFEQIMYHKVSFNLINNGLVIDLLSVIPEKYEIYKISIDYYWHITNLDIDYLVLYNQLKEIKHEEHLNQELLDQSNNLELIKSLINYKGIKIHDYTLRELLHYKEDLSYLINNVELNDNNENYEILKCAIKYSTLNTIKQLLTKIKSFKDWGLINELIIYNDPSEETNEIFKLLIMDKRCNINISDGIILDNAIEYNSYIAEYLIKNKGFLIKERHFQLALNLKKYNIYNMLSENNYIRY